MTDAGTTRDIKASGVFSADEIADEVLRRVRERLGNITPADAARKVIPVAVSARHMHVSTEILRKLFGDGHELSKLKDLSQHGQFAAKECVTVVGPNLKSIENVRILGPARNYTQVELSMSDARKLGLELPVRDSGELGGSPGIVLIGARGPVQLSEGAVRAIRHIHMTADDIAGFGVRDKETVRVKAGGDKALIFDMVKVKVDPTYVLELHLDTDDANAAGLSDGDTVELTRG